MRSLHPCWLLVTALFLIPLTGCSTAGPGARAIRTVEREHPTPELARAHIQQMKDTLTLLRVLLSDTAYTPGAPWIAELPIDDAKLERARALLGDPAERRSFVRAYAVHVLGVIEPVRRAAATAPQVPGAAPVASYRSIRHALAAINPQLANVGTDVEDELRRATEAAELSYAAATASESPDPNAVAQAERAKQEAAARMESYRARLNRPFRLEDLTEPEKGIVRDAVTATSVALRLAVEAVSLGVVAALETAAVARQAGQNWAITGPGLAQLVSGLPADARETYGLLQADVAAMKDLLSRLQQVDPFGTVAFQYKDGLVDEVVGFAWDSVHLDVQAGGEVLWYAALADDEARTDGDGNTYDYSGRTTRLQYDVQPIVLAQANASLKFDIGHWVDALGLKLGYATNRMYKSGGDLGSTSLANELGVTGTASDALNAALAVAGVRVGGRLAHFTHGTVTVLDAVGAPIASTSLTLDMKQLDVGYDLAPRYGSFVKSFTLGFRYFDYALPRILYELVNVTPDLDTGTYVLSRETPAQAIRTRYYMASLGMRLEQAVSDAFSPYLGLDLGAGYGPTRYYFPIDDAAAPSEANRAYTERSAPGLSATGALGFRYHVGDVESRFRMYLDAYYQATLIKSILRQDKDVLVDMAMTDVFHGPRAAFGLTF